MLLSLRGIFGIGNPVTERPGELPLIPKELLQKRYAHAVTQITIRVCFSKCNGGYKPSNWEITECIVHPQGSAIDQIIRSVGVSDSEHDHSSTCFRLPTIHALGFNSTPKTRDHRSRLTDRPSIRQISCQGPPETRPIRRHTIQASFTQQVPPKIYCGASLTLLLHFCTVPTPTANSVFSTDAGLNTSASVKKTCRAGAGPLSFIPKT